VTKVRHLPWVYRLHGQWLTVLVDVVRHNSILLPLLWLWLVYHFEWLYLLSGLPNKLLGWLLHRLDHDGLNNLGRLTFLLAWSLHRWSLLYLLLLLTFILNALLFLFIQNCRMIDNLHGLWRLLRNPVLLWNSNLLNLILLLVWFSLRRWNREIEKLLGNRIWAIDDENGLLLNILIRVRVESRVRLLQILILWILFILLLEPGFLFFSGNGTFIEALRYLLVYLIRLITS